jgi:hypothetical protein
VEAEKLKGLEFLGISPPNEELRPRQSTGRSSKTLKSELNRVRIDLRHPEPILYGV